jgi:hypothetical protein
MDTRFLQCRTHGEQFIAVRPRDTSEPMLEPKLGTQPLTGVRRWVPALEGKFRQLHPPAGLGMDGCGFIIRLPGLQRWNCSSACNIFCFPVMETFPKPASLRGVPLQAALTVHCIRMPFIQTSLRQSSSVNLGFPFGISRLWNRTTEVRDIAYRANV